MLARQFMTHPVISIQSSNTIRSAMLAMERHKIRHLPVYEDERLVGVFSKRDVDSVASVASFFELGRKDYDDFIDRPVHELLKTKFQDEGAIVSVSPYDTLPRVCSRMLEHGLSAIPVISDLGLVGMISFVDVLQAVDGGFVNIPTLR